MPRSLSLASYVEKAKIDSNVPYLLAIEVNLKNPITFVIEETLRFVHNDDEVQFQNETYYPTQFDLTYKEESGSTSECRLTVNDYSQVIAQRQEDYYGAIGSTVRVMILNHGNVQANQAAAQPDVEMFFEITASSSSDWSIHWTLGAENALALPFPRYRQRRDRCRFRYKDEHCGYTGALPECDLSLDGANGCTAHDNVINFGGFPGINNSS